MNEKANSPVGVGVITIFTVLLVLSLSVFAALTLSTARADLRLSQIGADTARAWYEADAEAARLYAAFREGGQEELETDIPMTDSQSLHLHLVREADGTVSVLEWRAAGGAEQEGDSGLDVWDGTAP